MTDKELLLKDLSARLPYGVIVHFSHTNIDEVLTSIEIDREDINKTRHNGKANQCEVILYLYTHDTATIDTKLREEFSAMVRKEGLHFDNVTDFYNRHHIDYRGMIDKGLAIKITKENNPYK